MENDIEREKNNSRQETTEKKLAYQEIKQLQDLIGEMEKTINRLSEELISAKTVTDERQSQINELDTQRRIYEERFELKGREMEQFILSKAETDEY